MKINIREKTSDADKFGFFPGGALLLSPFAKILSGVLLAGLLASSIFTVVKVFEVKNLEIKLLNSQKDAEHYKSEFEICATVVDSQNIQIAQIQADAQRDIDNIKRVNEDLVIVTKNQKREIEKLKSRPAPVGCDAARNWLRDNIDIFEDKR